MSVVDYKRSLGTPRYTTAGPNFSSNNNTTWLLLGVIAAVGIGAAFALAP